MPLRASLIPCFCLLTLLSGCTAFPVQQSRAVTLDEIRGLLDERAAVNEQPQVILAPSPVQCLDFSGVEEQLEGQRVLIARMNKQLQNLTAATPAFANSACPPTAPATYYDDKLVVGSSEWIYLNPPGRHYRARIDSGATTSSLSARDVTRFERNGKRWVRFTLKHDEDAEAVEIEAPLVRTAVIRQASAESPERRLVVQLTVNLGTNLQQDAEFTLSDRSQMSYPILLGREFLRDITLIDVGRSYVQPLFRPDNGRLPAPVTVPPADTSDAAGRDDDDEAGRPSSSPASP